MSNEIITDLEKQTGFIAIDRNNVPDAEDREEFIEIVMQDMSKFILINYSDRIKFLNDNGYEITFENLIDASLATAQSKKLKRK